MSSRSVDEKVNWAVTIQQQLEENELRKKFFLKAIRDLTEKQIEEATERLKEILERMTRGNEIMTKCKEKIGHVVIENIKFSIYISALEGNKVSIYIPKIVKKTDSPDVNRVARNFLYDGLQLMKGYSWRYRNLRIGRFTVNMPYVYKTLEGSDDLVQMVKNEIEAIKDIAERLNGTIQIANNFEKIFARFVIKSLSVRGE